jgi:predicted DsbA family dithiol-disulfide isomerase
VEVEKLQRDYPDVDIRWVPFLLDPSIPPEGRSRTPQTNADTPKSALELRGEASGISFRRGRTFTPNTHLALELQEYAYQNEHPVDDLHRHLFKAHFDDFDNIGEIDTLVRIASEHGLPADDVRDALTTGRYRDEVDAGIEWSRAARAVGVTGIPTFIFNERYAIVGAQEYPTFQRVMEHIEQESRGEG